MRDLPESDERLSRRRFIARGLAGAAVAMGAGILPQSVWGQGSRRAYKITRWLGDDFTVGHRMRNGKSPVNLDNPRVVKHDVVIVGGGMSALVAAYRMPDVDYLMLEQYDELGGNSRGLTRNGMAFSLGAAYYTDQEGPAGALVAELGLKPAVFEADNDSFYTGGAWRKQKDFAAAGLKQLRPIIEPLGKGLAKRSLHDMDTSLETADRTPFVASMTAFDPQFKLYMDSFLKSSTCGGINELSLLGAADIAAELFERRYVLPGGNPSVGRALISRLKDKETRVKKGCFVWSIKIKDGGAQVFYQDKKNPGEIVRVDCKHVIICTPPMVTGRILTGVSNAAKGNLFWFRYGSYLVANMVMDKPVLRGGYDNFYDGHSFTDVTIAEAPYIANGLYKDTMGSVLTFYKPWPPGAAGRSLLLDGKLEELLDPLLKGFHPIAVKSAPDYAKHIRELILTRWGHAIAVPVPGYFSKITRVYGANLGAYYTLAHSSLFGIQCLENAIAAGTHAAGRMKGEI